ncbi:MAG: hypothetical protein WDW38_009683 [Sanguina aurantia]
MHFVRAPGSCLATTMSAAEGGWDASQHYAYQSTPQEGTPEYTAWFNYWLLAGYTPMSQPSNERMNGPSESAPPLPPAEPPVPPYRTSQPVQSSGTAVNKAASEPPLPGAAMDRPASQPPLPSQVNHLSRPSSRSSSHPISNCTSSNGRLTSSSSSSSSNKNNNNNNNVNSSKTTRLTTVCHPAGGLPKSITTTTTSAAAASQQQQQQLTLEQQQYKQYYEQQQYQSAAYQQTQPQSLHPQTPAAMPQHSSQHTNPASTGSAYSVWNPTANSYQQANSFNPPYTGTQPPTPAAAPAPVPNSHINPTPAAAGMVIKPKWGKQPVPPVANHRSSLPPPSAPTLPHRPTHQDRRLDALPARFQQYVHAVLAGQAKIEQYQVGCGIAQGARGRVAVAQPRHRVRLLFQRMPDGLTQRDIVFHEQNVHGGLPVVSSGRSGRDDGSAIVQRGAGEHAARQHAALAPVEDQLPLPAADLSPKHRRTYGREQVATDFVDQRRLLQLLRITADHHSRLQRGEGRCIELGQPAENLGRCLAKMFGLALRRDDALLQFFQQLRSTGQAALQPHHGRAIMDVAVPKIRWAALNTLVKVYKTSLPVSLFAQVLGFMPLLSPAKPEPRVTPPTPNAPTAPCPNPLVKPEPQGTHQASPHGSPPGTEVAVAASRQGCGSAPSDAVLTDTRPHAGKHVEHASSSSACQASAAPAQGGGSQGGAVPGEPAVQTVPCPGSPKGHATAQEGVLLGADQSGAVSVEQGETAVVCDAATAVPPVEGLLPGCTRAGYVGRFTAGRSVEEGMAACIAWLTAHGAVLEHAAAPEPMVDVKLSAPQLKVPTETSKVAHGDENLSLDDFLTRVADSSGAR